MDVTQALKDAENGLRDFIADLLTKSIGNGWEDKCGVSAERIEKWRERKVIESKRQPSGVVEERLLYYADFYDLKPILKKHWPLFADALGDFKTFDVWLSELEKLRDPDAHRRELLPHQLNLALGISGEIRTRVARYRSAQETSDSYFPRIDCVRDSLGDIWLCGSHYVLITGKSVRPGDYVDIVVTASDPLDEVIEYSVGRGRPEIWQLSNSFIYTFQREDVAKMFSLPVRIRSQREYHAHGPYDDFMEFFYTVLPPR
jgi:hypothetical protein